MTKQKKFKAKAHERAEARGTSYTAARRDLHNDGGSERAKYRSTCLTAWRAVAERFAGDRTTVVWEAPAEVAHVLAEVTRFAPQNHLHLPTIGGLDLEGARESHEAGCMELDMGHRVDVIKPAFLKLVRPDNDPLGEWAYFWLQTAALTPSHLWTEPAFAREQSPDVFHRAHMREELLEIAPGRYVDRSHWDKGNLGEDEHGDEIPIPDHARLVVRYFRGAFLLLTKGGGYNDGSEYQAQHERMGEETFRDAIQARVDRLQKLGLYGADRES